MLASVFLMALFAVMLSYLRKDPFVFQDVLLDNTT